LPTHTDALRLTVVFRAELFWPSVGDALKRAAVFVIGAVGVLAATREAAVVGTRTAGARHALLRLRTGGIETCQQALAVDADARIAALEVELAAKGRWVGRIFERIETKPVVGTGRSHGTFVLLRALTYTTECGAGFADGAVGLLSA
jgi:hypothetical protein